MTIYPKQMIKIKDLLDQTWNCWQRNQFSKKKRIKGRASPVDKCDNEMKAMWKALYMFSSERNRF